MTEEQIKQEFGVTVTYKPLDFTGRRQISGVELDGEHVFNEWTFLPKIFDFKEDMEVTHLMECYCMTLGAIHRITKELGIKEYTPTENAYDNENNTYWVWIKELPDAIKFFQYCKNNLDKV